MVSRSCDQGGDHGSLVVVCVYSGVPFSVEAEIPSLSHHHYTIWMAFHCSMWACWHDCSFHCVEMLLLNIHTCGCMCVYTCVHACMCVCVHIRASWDMCTPVMIHLLQYSSNDTMIHFTSIVRIGCETEVLCNFTRNKTTPTLASVRMEVLLPWQMVGALTVRTSHPCPTPCVPSYPTQSSLCTQWGWSLVTPL